MPGIFPVEIDQAAASGAPAPSGLSADEKVAYDRLQFVYQKGIAYGYQMGLRPQTLYGIADSPVGLAAYFLDHDARSYDLISRVFAGKSEGLTRDDISPASERKDRRAAVPAQKSMDAPPRRRIRYCRRRFLISFSASDSGKRGVPADHNDNSRANGDGGNQHDADPPGHMPQRGEKTRQGGNDGQARYRK
jgi:hypothetical protein